MRTATHIACAVLAALALPACFAEVEDESISYTHSIPVCAEGQTSCTFQGVTGPLSVLAPFMIGSSPVFTIDLGDQEFLDARKDLGPATLENTLTLNRATLTAPAGAGAIFEGILELRLRQLAQATDDCSGLCAAPACREIATYDRDRDGPATTDIVLRGSSLNLLETMSGGQLNLCVVGRGTPPSVNWSADATLDMAIKAHASFP